MTPSLRQAVKIICIIIDVQPDANIYVYIFRTMINSHNRKNILNHDQFVTVETKIHV